MTNKSQDERDWSVRVEFDFSPDENRKEDDAVGNKLQEDHLPARLGNYRAQVWSFRILPIIWLPSRQDGHRVDQVDEATVAGQD